MRNNYLENIYKYAKRIPRHKYYEMYGETVFLEDMVKFILSESYNNLIDAMESYELVKSVKMKNGVKVGKRKAVKNEKA